MNAIFARGADGTIRRTIRARQIRIALPLRYADWRFAYRSGRQNIMDLLDRLLGHDHWTSRQLLEIAAALDDERLDRRHDIGHRTIRATLDHIVHNVEAWSSAMDGDTLRRNTDTSTQGMICRLDAAHRRLHRIARQIAARGAWDEAWTDRLEDPPQAKSFGAAIAHVITHSMHHRAQVLYMLRLVGVTDLPECDVFSWEFRPEAHRR
jgi:uncharacterized damage-inducible protein DinB